MKNMLIHLIEIYQKFLSPDHSFWARGLDKPPYCKHIPTCSQYAVEAIEKKWSLKWSFMWIGRIFRCMPWNKWGYDPVEKTNMNLK